MSGNTTELWVESDEPVGWECPSYRPATDAEKVAAVAGLDGAETVWLCSEHGRIGHRNACDGRARVEACPMVRSVVVPLEADKEDTDE